MKKRMYSSFIIFLLVTLLLTSTGTAIAAPLNDGPVATALFDGSTVPTTVIPVNKLPGTVTNEDGKIFPIGHENGDLEFSGDGVQVSGVVDATKLSMPLVNYAYGWNGSIYQYRSGGWVALPTSITTSEESNDAVAETTINYDGIYALIVSYQAPANAQDGKCSKVDDVYGGYVVIEGEVVFLFGIGFDGTFPPTWIKEGDEISIKPVNFTDYEGLLEGTSLIDSVNDNGDGTTTAIAFFRYGEFGFTLPEAGLPSFILQVKVNGCKYNLNFPEDFEEMGIG